MKRRGFFGRLAAAIAGTAAAAKASAKPTPQLHLPSGSSPTPSPSMEELNRAFDQVINPGDPILTTTGLPPDGETWYMLNTKYFKYRDGRGCLYEGDDALRYHGVVIKPDFYAPGGDFSVIPKAPADKQKAAHLEELIKAHEQRAVAKMNKTIQEEYGRVVDGLFKPNPVMAYIKKNAPKARS